MSNTPNDPLSFQSGPSRTKRQQALTLGVALALACGVGWGLVSVMSDGPPESSERTAHTATVITMAGPPTDSARLWVERTQNSVAKALKTTESLQQQLELLTQAKQAQETANQQQGHAVEALQAQVIQLTQQVAQNNKNNASAAEKEENFPNGSGTPDTDGPVPVIEGISEDRLTLSPSSVSQAPSLSPSPFPSSFPGTKPAVARTPDTYVPAGTFVRAVMLAGADASAGTTGQSNPVPLLFRILEPGHLPNHHTSHLKDCLATAAVVGDISSERGHVRLERLSCVAPHGDVIDVSVEGTVFGPEGKNGVRGVPLWREGALLKRAFLAGTLSGLSGRIAQKYTSPVVSPWGIEAVPGTLDTLKTSVSTGASTAMDKMADYHIRRADQYHPVIQLSAGTLVDLVFLKGFFLTNGQASDAEHAEKVPSWADTPPEPDSAPASPLPSPLPLTPQQIAALKAANHDVF